MSSGFDRQSLVVDLDCDSFDFDSRILFGPSVFGRPELRRFTHECVHLWQQLGSGYLANLARDRWSDLNTFEKTGEMPPVRKSRFGDVDPQTGFSVQQLSEALCRFWDVHIFGPADLLGEPYAGELLIKKRDLPRESAWVTDGLPPEVVDRLRHLRAYSGEQYDRWMLGEDDYAEPYRRVLQAGGSYWAASVFPIVGYYSLQTRNPCRAFMASLYGLRDLRLPKAGYIHDTWREIFARVALTCAKAALKSGGSMLTPGAQVIRAMPGHRVYRHYSQLLAMAQQYWSLDMRLALPGDPEFRFQLTTFCLPALIRFHDGQGEPDAVAAKMARATGVLDVLPQPGLATEAADISRRFRRMDLARLRGR